MTMHSPPILSGAVIHVPHAHGCYVCLFCYTLIMPIAITVNEGRLLVIDEEAMLKFELASYITW